MRRIIGTFTLTILAACSTPPSDVTTPPPPPPPAPVASVGISPATMTVPVGGNGTLTAKPRDEAGAELLGRVISWTSSQPAIATVSGGVVTGVAGGGPVTITATSEGISGTAQVTVTTVPVATVTLDQATLSVVQGLTGTLIATAKDDAGHTLPNRAMTWNSSNQAIATVSGGIVTGVTPGGPVTITVTSEGKTATAQITVTPAPVASVVVSPPTASVQAGLTTTLTAQPKNSSGADLVGRTVTWSTSNPAIATVSNGVVLGVAAGGPVTITATSETKTGTAQITVTAPPGPTFTVSDELRIGATNGFVGFNTAFVIASNGKGASASGTGLYDRDAGGIWSPTSATISGTPTFLNVDADPTNTLWAVGSNGTIAKRGASTWSTEASGTAVALRGISIRADGSGFAVGDNGLILSRSVLGVWSPIGSPTALTLTAVKTTSSNFGLAIGGTTNGQGVALKWDGANWTTVPFPGGAANFWPNNLVVVSQNEAYISGIAGADLLAARYTILAWNGTAWSISLQRPVEVYPYTAGGAGCANGVVYFGYQYGTVYRGQSGVWTTVATNGQVASAGFNLACDSDNTLLLGGSQDLLMRYNGSWSLLRWRPNLVSVAAANATTAYAATFDAVAQMSSGVWTRTPIPIPNGAPVFIPPKVYADATQALVSGSPPGRHAAGNWTFFPGVQASSGAMWGPTSNQVFVAGGSNKFDTWNGASWTTTPVTGSFDRISGIGDFGVAFGNSGTAVKFSSGAWTPIATAPSSFATPWAFSSSNVWLIGGGSIYKWDGNAWSTTATSGMFNVPVLVARDPGEVYAFTSGNVYRLNGTAWTNLGSTGGTISAAAIVGNQIIGVGNDGLVVRATIGN